ncbi:ThiF family adenylyltransferase [Herbaspirillum sp. SJZ107]|uniref:ThiF family adenylyltransferase n=1 Tax=Herbaspirillum sp. SJZ107 TaxID=2572881 RepID=UPI0011503A68|nr:ThiF family adenylyltransferase [Herbaspirillum sp. SJZ107]TQK03369.1 adenylyltransferase/sulfurtransferase [Herbaspirillum sp. SJZ107]
MDANDYRYSRQTRLPEIGAAGAARLKAAHVMIVGVGALGSQVAELLCRAGIRKLTLVDPDVVDASNLQRQMLYGERDVERGLPKVAAARERLLQINSLLEVDVHATEFDAAFLARTGLPADVDVLVDGLDGLDTRLQLNAAAVAAGVPYVYGAALGMEGCCFTVLPGETACLHCLLGSPALHQSQKTCAVAGVLASTIGQVATTQFTETVKLLVGRADACRREMVYFNVWENTQFALPVMRRADCEVCVKRRGETGTAAAPARSRLLCGRNALQLQVPPPAPAFAHLAARAPLDSIRSRTEYHLERLHVFEGRQYRLTFFSDGRVIVDGTRDEDLAHALLADALEAS